MWTLLVSVLLFVLGSLLPAYHSSTEVKVWEQSPWSLWKDENVVFSIDTNVNRAHNYPAMITQRSDYYWQYFRDRSDDNFYGQRFHSSNDSMSGDLLRLNQANSDDSKSFGDVISLNSNDGFVFGYSSADIGGSSLSTPVIKIFNADGSEVTGDIIVESDTSKNMYLKDLISVYSSNDESSSSSLERIIVAYTKINNSSVTVFDVNGTNLVSKQLDPMEMNNVEHPRVTWLSHNEFLAVWRVKQDSTNYYRKAQIFQVNGSVSSSIQTISEGLSASEGQDYQLLTLDENMFMIVSQNGSNNEQNIIGSIFDRNFNQCGNDFLISLDTNNEEENPQPFLIYVNKENNDNNNNDDNWMLLNDSVIFGVGWTSHNHEGSGIKRAVAQIFRFRLPSLNQQCTEHDNGYSAIGSQFIIYTLDTQITTSVNQGASFMNDDNHQGRFALPFRGYGLRTSNTDGTAVQRFRLALNQSDLNDESSNLTDSPAANPTKSPEYTLRNAFSTFPPTSSPTKSTLSPTYPPSMIPSQFPTLLNHPSHSPQSDGIWSTPPTRNPTPLVTQSDETRDSNSGNLEVFKDPLVLLVIVSIAVFTCMCCLVCIGCLQWKNFLLTSNSGLSEVVSSLRTLTHLSNANAHHLGFEQGEPDLPIGQAGFHLAQSQSEVGMHYDNNHNEDGGIFAGMDEGDDHDGNVEGPGFFELAEQPQIEGRGEGDTGYNNNNDDDKEHSEKSSSSSLMARIVESPGLVVENADATPSDIPAGVVSSLYEV